MSWRPSPAPAGDQHSHRRWPTQPSQVTNTAIARARRWPTQRARCLGTFSAAALPARCPQRTPPSTGGAWVS